MKKGKKMKPRIIIMGHQHTSMMVEKGRYIIKFPDVNYIYQVPTVAERGEPVKYPADRCSP